jgi:hypothetical protein
MKTVALVCCVLASAIADFVPAASGEADTFKKVEAEREGKAFRSVSGDGVLIADGAGEIVVAPGLQGAVVGSVVGRGPVALASGPVAAVAVASTCRTEFITELVTQVCEETVRNVCVTEHAEVCEERVATRTEQECGEHVVAEPVEHCHPGPGHEVCEETHHQECTTSYVTECYGHYRGKRHIFRNKEKRRKEPKEPKEPKYKNGPRCHRVPQQHCHSAPSRHCHLVAGPPVCSVTHVEKRVHHCNPVQVHHPETICRTVPNQVCHQEPAQACRKVRPQPQQRTQEVC